MRWLSSVSWQIYFYICLILVSEFIKFVFLYDKSMIVDAL